MESQKNIVQAFAAAAVPKQIANNISDFVLARCYQTPSLSARAYTSLQKIQIAIKESGPEFHNV